DSIVVRPSNCTDAFGPDEDWGPTDGNAWGTAFADANGDGCADAIDVEYGGVFVRVAMPCPVPAATAAQFNPNLEPWTDGPYNGNIGTWFADVTGDGKADAIVLNNAGSIGITVRRSDGTRFLPNESWTDDTFAGGMLPLLFGDVTGDGMADVVVIKA